MALQDEIRGISQRCSAGWVQNLAHPKDIWVETGVRFRPLDSENCGLGTDNISPEQSYTPLRYKGAGPYIAMASRIPTPNHHTIRRYMPAINHHCLS